MGKTSKILFPEKRLRQLESMNQVLNRYCSDLETHCDSIEKQLKNLRKDNQQLREAINQGLGENQDVSL